MKPQRSLTAKIIEHSHGLGVPSADSVRKRALELARIDGRKDFTEEDWKQAKLELHGGHPGTSPETEEDEMIASSSGRDMMAGSIGHHVENRIPENSESLGEELVAEGLDEAAHEQMLEASRREEEEEEQA